MKMTRLRISHLRSIAGHPGAMDLHLTAGCNVLVGPNGSGKSTVLRAIELAIDPHGHAFQPDRDRPRPADGASVTSVADPTAQTVNPMQTDAMTDPAATRIDVWWDDQWGNTVRPPAEPIIGHDELAMVVHHAADGTPVHLAPGTRLVVVPAEHQRRQALLAHIQALLDRWIASGADLSGSDDRLSPGLDAVLGGSAAVHVTGGQGATMTVTTRGRRHAPADLATPELLTLVVTMLAVVVSDDPTSADTPWVVVIDQPETGLHPAAQQRLAIALDQLASNRSVSVVFASHSPFMIARTAQTRVFELASGADGHTVCTSIGDGAGPLAEVVDSLFDGPVLPDMLDRAATIADTAAGIVVVEGDTDAAYITLACSLAGRPELRADLHLAVSHGTRRMALDALALRPLAGNRPLCVLVDHDSEGRAVAHVLTGRLGFRNHTEVVSVAVAFEERWRGHEWDAEDLLPPDLLARFVDHHDEDVVLRGKVRRPDGQWHWDLTTEGKAMLPDWLAEHATAADLAMWFDLLVMVRKRMGLDHPGTAESGATDVDTPGGAPPT